MGRGAGDFGLEAELSGGSNAPAPLAPRGRLPPTGGLPPLSESRGRGGGGGGGGFGLEAELGGGGGGARGLEPIRDPPRASALRSEDDGRDARRPRALATVDQNRPRARADQSFGLDSELGKSRDRPEPDRVSFKREDTNFGIEAELDRRQDRDADRRRDEAPRKFGLEAELGGDDYGRSTNTSREVHRSQNLSVDTSEEGLARRDRGVALGPMGGGGGGGAGVSVHLIGQIVGGTGFPERTTYCTYEIKTGSSWKLVAGGRPDASGKLVASGQTLACTAGPDSDLSAYSHPLDLCYQTDSVQGWPKLVVKVYSRSIWYGRSQFLAYGVCNLPINVGAHRLSIATWRPNDRTTRVKDEIMGYFTGLVPELANEQFVYSRANSQQQNLLTVGVGTVHVDISLMVRNFERVHLGGTSLHLEQDIARQSREKELKRSQDIAKWREEEPDEGEVSEGVRLVRQGRDSRLATYKDGRRASPAGGETPVATPAKSLGSRTPAATPGSGRRTMEERRKRMQELEERIQREKNERASRLGNRRPSRESPPQSFGLEAEVAGAGAGAGKGSTGGRDSDTSKRSFGLDGELGASTSTAAASGGRSSGASRLDAALAGSEVKATSERGGGKGGGAVSAGGRGGASGAGGFGLDADLEEEVLEDIKPAPSSSPKRGGGGFGLDAEL